MMWLRVRIYLLWIAVFLALSPVHAGAEGVRAVVVAVLQVSADRPEGETASLGYADALAVSLASPSVFVQGIEIEIRIPKPLQSNQGVFIWTLYKLLDPVPSRDRVAYDGEQVLSQTLPARAGVVLQIPVSTRHSLRTSPYAVVLPVLLEAGDFPMLFKLSSLTKGLSTEQETAKYQVKVRPVFTDEGALRLDLVHPEDLSIPVSPNVYIDEKKLESWRDLVFLKKGAHTLQVSGEGIRDETRTFAVESGKISALEIKLQGTKPVLMFEVPANAVVLFDDQPVDHTSGGRLVVEPGEHALVCRIGDYTITRKFVTVRGKTYSIVFSVDVQIQESP